jgi:hypothetical protein
MSLDQFIPQIWSARLMQGLQKQLIYGQSGVVNKDYEGEIAEAGDRVHIHSIGDITISDYTRDATVLNYELLTDERRTLLIDQSKYFAFKVDDLDVAQQKPKVIDGASQRATYHMADVADKFLAAKYADAGLVLDDGAGAAVQWTAANVYQNIVAAKQKLDEANVPSDGRFMILPPWIISLALLDDKFIVEASKPSILNGQIASVAGFSILQSNNVPDTGTAPVVSHPIAGHSMALSFAEQIVKVEGIRLQDSFSDAVRGLHLYGAKVVEPDALLHVLAKK